MYASWKKLLIKIVLSFQNKIYKLQDECDALRDKLHSKNTENHSLKKQLKENQKITTSLQKTYLITSHGGLRMIGEECIQVLCLYEHGCEQLPKNQHITTKETRQKGKKFQTEIDTLQKTNKGLKASLKRHENSNTPSSAKLPGSKKKQSNKIQPNTKKKKQGGQKEHDEIIKYI